MRVRVDVDKCIGVGQCVRVAGMVFAQNEDDGIVVLLDETPSDALRSAVDNAVRLCPARAIAVEDE